jgi:hypothetical protein
MPQILGCSLTAKVRSGGALPLLAFMLLFGTVLLAVCPHVAQAKDTSNTSAQLLAFAPNAGGQAAYSLRRSNNEREWSLFLNQYLRVGKRPLGGAAYSLRYPVCDQSCILQLYVQNGVGISSVGPFIEVLWGTNLFSIIRLDIAAHLYFTASRPVLWSYPLWLGFSLPI